MLTENLSAGFFQVRATATRQSAAQRRRMHRYRSLPTACRDLEWRAFAIEMPAMSTGTLYKASAAHVASLAAGRHQYATVPNTEILSQLQGSDKDSRNEKT